LNIIAIPRVISILTLLSIIIRHLLEIIYEIPIRFTISCNFTGRSYYQ